MSWTRRHFLACSSALALAGCSGSEPTQERPASASGGGPPPLPGGSPTNNGEAASALARGAEWLWSQQASDGSFPSRTIGLLGGGASLTGFCLGTLLELPQAMVPVRSDAIGAALTALLDRTDDRGAVGLSGAAADYPVYATALALEAMARVRPGGWRPLAKRWSDWLLTQQIRGEAWAGHPAQGGFCFGYAQPRLPPEAGHVDLSMSRRAIEALVLSGMAPEEEAMKDALAFVLRCRAPGGGFVYSAADADLNKGGCDDTLSNEAARIPVEPGEATPLPCRGYGSATTDGILASRALGQTTEHHEQWLAGLHKLSENPGLTEGQAVFAPAMRGYYRAGAAAVFAESPHAPSGWAADLVQTVLSEQSADGSWVNASALQKENDPLVATAFALQALSRALSAPA